MILEKIAEFIIAHWRVFGTLFILAGTAIYEHHEGYLEGVQVHKDYVAKENIERLKLIDDNEHLKNQLEVAKNDAQTRIDNYTNTHPTRKLYLPCTAPTVEIKPASGVSPATPRRESLSIPVPESQIALDRFMEQTEQLMKEADTTVNQCRVVTNWAAAQ
jgi:hypothetical protein